MEAGVWKQQTGHFRQPCVGLILSSPFRFATNFLCCFQIPIPEWIWPHHDILFASLLLVWGNRQQDYKELFLYSFCLIAINFTIFCQESDCTVVDYTHYLSLNKRLLALQFILASILCHLQRKQVYVVKLQFCVQESDLRKDNSFMYSSSSSHMIVSCMQLHDNQLFVRLA